MECIRINVGGYLFLFLCVIFYEKGKDITEKIY